MTEHSPSTTDELQPPRDGNTRSTRDGTSRSTRDEESLLSVRNLRTRFHTDDGVVRAVDGVDFDVGRGETVCLVGESGSGKTVTVESITRLIRSPPGEIDGEIRFDGRDVTAMSEAELRRLRGDRIGHVFQNPDGSLNPVYTIGAQLREAVRAHRDVNRRAARERSVELLEAVGIPAPASRVDDYPHQFSGGMKQRVAIAMALACEPDLLIADEPTTALDVTVESAILDLLRELQAEFGMSICYVTHDLGVVAEIADRVVVMYAGEVVERASVYDLFDRPAHPYTRRLLSCLPGRDGRRSPRADTTRRGSRPDPHVPPAGCRFADRCPHAIADCRGGESPPLVPVPESDATHVAACLFYQDGYDESALEPPSDGKSRRTTGRDSCASTDRGIQPTSRIEGDGTADGGTSTDCEASTADGPSTAGERSVNEDGERS